jgi:DNA invertase Pin-like site-specific DNA recombinase
MNCSRAKAKGIKIGRPRLAAELRHEITRLAARGETAYAIAKALHIDRHTAAKYLPLTPSGSGISQQPPNTRQANSDSLI